MSTSVRGGAASAGPSTRPSSAAARAGFRNAFAGIALPNEASVALHQAVGFVALGHYRNVGFKLGAGATSVWLQCPLGDLPASRSVPRACRNCPGSPDAALR